MSYLNTKNGLRKVATAIIAALCLATLNACQGDTDGGKATDDTVDAIHTQFVSDGGAGATLNISVVGGNRFPVATETGFTVTALDPSGAPLAFVRIFCETEKGIAIIEPSSGGVAFEHTGANGVMSGRIGGVTPGSFLMECRAPEGFGLVARTSIVLTGEIPDGFIGFPGAAGGNLGGGNMVDLTPDPDDGDGVRIVEIEFSDGEDISTSGPIDISFQTCDAGTPADPDDDFPEPFFFNDYLLTVANDTTERVLITSVAAVVELDGGPLTLPAVAKTVEISPSSTGVVDGLLTEFLLGGPKRFVGTGVAVPTGTHRINFTVTGVSDAGTPFTESSSATVTFDAVNRCGG